MKLCLAVLPMKMRIQRRKYLVYPVAVGVVVIAAIVVAVDN